MEKQYTVIREFKVKDTKIVILNENQTLADSQKPLILVDGKTYPYQLTHNENWIIVKTDFDFKDKQIEFVGEGEFTHDISDKLTEWPEF